MPEQKPTPASHPDRGPKPGIVGPAAGSSDAGRVLVKSLQTSLKLAKDNANTRIQNVTVQRGRGWHTSAS